MFEPVKNLTLLAARKYQLDDQALGSLVCERARQLIAQSYPNFAEVWAPQKFVAGSLTIRATGSSGSELFMRTQDLLVQLNQLELPKKVQHIKIVKV